jgi:hypothetical protein
MNTVDWLQECVATVDPAVSISFGPPRPPPGVSAPYGAFQMSAFTVPFVVLQVKEAGTNGPGISLVV